MKKNCFLVFLLLSLIIFNSCNNSVFNKLDKNESVYSEEDVIVVKFTVKGILETSSRLIKPYEGYNEDAIADIQLNGLKYNPNTNNYDLTIQKSYTSLSELLQDTLNVSSGTWNFTINAKQSDLPELHDSIFIDINEESNNLIEFNLKNYEQYNFIYNVYVPTSYNIKRLYCWIWNGKESFSINISDSTKITDGTYSNYTKFVVQLFLPIEKYYIQMSFYDNNDQIGTFYDSILISKNNLTEGNIIVNSIEAKQNYSKITLKYPVNPESTTLEWNTTTVKVVDGRSFVFPTTSGITGYAVSEWYLNSDYTGDSITSKTISSSEPNIYYAKCVPIGLSDISFSNSYILDKSFSTDETNYKIFCTDNNSESYINLIPTLMKPNDSSLNLNVYNLNKVDGNSIEIKVTSKEYQTISRTYTFTYSKKNTVEYYAAVLPTYTAGTYTIKPYYSATIDDYKNLIKSIVNNSEIIVNLDLSNVTGINEIPQSTTITSTTTNIKSIILPNTIEKICSMAFYNWTGLTSITLPDSLSEIESSVFMNDTNLRGEFYVSKNLTTIAEGAIAGPRFDILTVSSENTQYEEYNGLLLNKDKTNIIALVGVTEFENNDYIIPSTVNTIDCYAFGYADIEYLNIPSTITNIEAFAFYYSKLKAITLPYSIKKLGLYSFGYCSALERADLSRIGTNDIGNYIFMSATNLSEVILPNGMESIPDYAFYQCENLTSVNIPNSITKIGQMAFFGCKQCNELFIPINVETIGQYAFYGSGIAGNLIIPNNVKKIDTMAFYNCKLITSIDIGSGLTKIPSMCFYYCENLQSVTIPNNILRIETNAFGSCSKLTNADFGNISDWSVTNGSVTKNITVSNTQTAANYLTSTYSSYEWYCKS